MQTVGELIEALLQFPKDATISVHCHGCCPNTHDIEKIIIPQETDHYFGQADVVIEV